MAGFGGAAENQHYVPKLVLRKFLTNDAKEQVAVFSKSNLKGFVTSISNIMAERRFNEFRASEEYMASFEDATSKIESSLAPTYENVVANRKIPTEPEDIALLSVFVAFQFLRTRSFRDQFKYLDESLAEKLKKNGDSLEDIEGYTPLNEDTLKLQHIDFIRSNIGKFSELIAGKELRLFEPPEGRSFYLGDAPVCLNNSNDYGPYGNLGFGVTGIEIYCPLSHDLCLAAWCPSISKKIRESISNGKREIATATLSPHGQKNVNKTDLNQLKLHVAILQKRLDDINSGNPIQLEGEYMDFLNTLQARTARDFLICKNGDFELAKRFVEVEGPGSGRWMTFG